MICPTVVRLNGEEQALACTIGSSIRNVFVTEGGSAGLELLMVVLVFGRSATLEDSASQQMKDAHLATAVNQGPSSCFWSVDKFGADGLLLYRTFLTPEYVLLVAAPT